MQPAGFLDDGGKGADWRTASKRSLCGAYGRWLAWLMSTGVDLAREPPADRITSDRMRGYIAFLKDRCAPVTLASYLGVLCMLLPAMFPDQKWRWLQILQRHYHRRASPTRNKTARLVPVQDLHQLGLGLMEAATAVLEQPGVGTQEYRQAIAAARNFRDGLIIALLALRPLRVRNLLGIEMGIHLRKDPSGHIMTFAATETKNGRALRQTWPQALEPHLCRYITEIRPMLIAAPVRGGCSGSNRPSGATLWIAQGGTPMTAGALQKALKRHTVPRFGHALNAHLFRDCAATTVANLDPNGVRYAATLLGHASLRTTERSYITPNSQEALGVHHDLITAMRFGRRQRRSTRAR